MTQSAGVSLEDLKKFLDCFNRHDVDGIMGYMAEDGVFETVRGPDGRGRRIEGQQSVRAYFAKMFEQMPDTHFGEDSHWISSDGTMGVSEWTLSGTQPDGSKMNVRGCDHFRFQGGKIVYKDSFLKMGQ